MTGADNACWSPSSWRSKPAQQLATWGENSNQDVVFGKLSALPPLVHPKEVDRLKSLLAECGRGERFVIQGGDCAERFVDCTQDRLESQLKLVLQMGMIVGAVVGKPTVRVCRIAGQYGKPRSKPTEVVAGHGEIMSFKGDNINGFDPAERKWDVQRLLQGYYHSSAALNYMRCFASNTDPEEVADIKLEALRPLVGFHKLQQRVEEIKSKGVGRDAVDFFTAHEAMQLDFEETLTRKVRDRYYNLGAHTVWIGDRTRQLDGAHVEYFRGISNPIGVKVGPSMKPDELKRLVAILNPAKEEGRLMLITRYGAGKVESHLPGHIEAVKESGIPVTWQCDGVHGNGIVASNKYKTRRVDDIIKEITECIEVHKRLGSVLGGVHLEVTGQESVTECLGGCVDITEDALPKNYETYCDPRLNYAQSVEMAFNIGFEASK